MIATQIKIISAIIPPVPATAGDFLSRYWNDVGRLIKKDTLQKQKETHSRGDVGNSFLLVNPFQAARQVPYCSELLSTQPQSSSSITLGAISEFKLFPNSESVSLGFRLLKSPIAPMTALTPPAAEQPHQFASRNRLARVISDCYSARNCNDSQIPFAWL